MANVSDWKGFEKMVANALGGKRRFRTTENYGKLADDVKFPKDLRRRFPKLRAVSIECKKRKNLNIHALFAEATSKYGEGDLIGPKKHIILASKVTRKGSLKRDIKKLKKKMMKRKKGFDKKKFKEREKQLRLKHDISALVTVELGFFRELWEHWVFGRKFTTQELRNG